MDDDIPGGGTPTANVTGALGEGAARDVNNEGGDTRGAGGTAVVRVVLPAHLRTLARVNGEVQLQVDGGVTLARVLDSLVARYPMLGGTIRDHDTGRRRAMLRFYACQEDYTREPLDTPLPDAVVAGAEPFLIVGAMAGG